MLGRRRVLPTCRARPGMPADAGTTLVEMLVSAAVFALVLALFTAGMVQMLRSAGKTEALDLTQNGFRTATQRLDREIRYATAIGTPERMANGNWHVVVASAGTCTELRLNVADSELDRSSPAGSGAWSTLTSEVTLDAGHPPFARVAGTDSGHQQLQLRLAVTFGGSRDETQRRRTVEFTAVNSSIDSDLPAGCAVSQ